MPITGCTPLIIKNADKVDVMAVEDLVSNMGAVFDPTPELDFKASISGWEVWSGNEFTDIKSIRMINNEYKPTVRASNSCGCVDFSQNSILYNSDCKPLQASYLTSGSSLQYFLPPRNILNQLCFERINQDRAHLVGSWLRLSLRIPYDHYKSNNFLKTLYSGGGGIKMCFTGRQQLKVPNDVINSTRETRSVFMRQFFKNNREVANGAVAAQGVMVMARSLGENVVMENEIKPSRKSLYEKDHYALTLVPRKHRQLREKLSISQVPSSRMPVRSVYSLETVSGNYAAGVGSIVFNY